MYGWNIGSLRLPATLMASFLFKFIDKISKKPKETVLADLEK